MAEEGEEASAKFVIPYFDFVIVSSGDDEGFVEVEVDAADGSVVFFKAVDDGAYSIIPSEKGEG
jgi:hypothetical protein